MKFIRRLGEYFKGLTLVRRQQIWHMIMFMFTMIFGLFTWLLMEFAGHYAWGIIPLVGIWFFFRFAFKSYPRE